MPKLDPDPFSPWSSSSGSDASQPSPLVLTSMCWWIGWTSKTQKSSSKQSDLTKESQHELNQRNETARINNYYKGLRISSSVLLDRQKPAACIPEGERHGPAASSNSIVLFENQELSSFGFKGDQRSSEILPVSKMKPDSGIVRAKTTSITDDKKKNDASLMKGDCSSTENPLSKKIEAEARKIMMSIDMEGKPKQTGREFSWENKYQPKTLNDFICHQMQAKILLNVMRIQPSGDHYIFEGRPGVGKRAMVMALLRELSGSLELETQDACMKVKLEGGPISGIQINVRVSHQHIEVDVSEVREYVTYVVTELMKERHSNQGDKNNQRFSHIDCRAIVLHKAEKLSRDAQLCIRSLLENYRGPIKVFFCCSNISRLREVRSLCKFVRLRLPSNLEIVEVLEFIANQEAIELPWQLAKNIAEKSHHNLRQAIRSFEATWRLNYPFKENQEILTGWEEELSNIANDIIKDQSPKQLYNIRAKLIMLVEYNISPEFVFSTLVDELKKHLSGEFQSKITALFLEYSINVGDSSVSKNLRYGDGDQAPWEKSDDPVRKNVQLYMRIEEFMVNFMSAYKFNIDGKNRGLKE